MVLIRRRVLRIPDVELFPQMALNRRTFLAATTALALAPHRGCEVWRQIEMGIDPETDQLAHETLAKFRYDGSLWHDTGERISAYRRVTDSQFAIRPWKETMWKLEACAVLPGACR